MPVTVDSSSIREMLGWSVQRKSFYAKGLFWLFYFDGENIVWRTSVDGVNFGEKNIFVQDRDAESFSVVHNENYVHITWHTVSTLYYRRGLLNSDGTITWDSKQVVYSVAGMSMRSGLCIALDSEGYPWIGFNRFDGTVNYPHITKSSTKDGTWTTESGFPYQLKALDRDNWGVLPVALTNGKMYILYGNATPVYGRLYDPISGMGSEVAITTYNVRGHGFSAVAEGDNIHLIYTCAIYRPWHLEHRYIKYTNGVWGTELLLRNLGDYEYYAELSRDPSTNIVYFIFVEDTTVYLMRNVNGEWETPISWILNEDTSELKEPIPNCVFQSLEKQHRYISVAWMAGKISVGTYNLRFEVLPIIPSSLKNAPNSGF